MGKANKSKKQSKSSKQNKKKKIWKKILIAIIVLIIVLIGIFAGLIVGLSSKYAITKEDLIIELSNSIVLDEDGNTISILNGSENRKIINKSEMGEYLPEAFIAIEDKRFNSHHGVDIKRTGAALISFVFNSGESSSVGGGSTITQQLVKNITNEKEDSGTAGAIRKIKEMIRAYQVENILSKDQILEMYMNIIFLGGNVNGVGMASQYYFSKDANQLSLAESAFIAGITHGPNGYNPFGEVDRTEKIENRTKTVLREMKEQGRISEEEYNTAIEELEKGLKFKKGTVVDISAYSSHTEAMLKQIINQLVTEKGMDAEYAKTYLLSNGLTIYSTEVPKVQSALEKEYAKSKYQVKTTVNKVVDGKKTKVKEAAQSAMVVIDHKTGKVVGAVGTLGEKVTGNLNRVNEITRQPGSSIKPIAVYGPSLQENKITAASVYEDKPLKFGTWTPSNAYSGFKGLTNMRQAMKVSSNTVAIQVLQDLGPELSIKYLKTLGLTAVDTQKDNSLPLALGGMSKGASPLQMAGAYAAIANDGEYIKPTFYSKVVDSDGNVIIESKEEKERVFSKQNAYILKQLLIEPTKAGGTATICKISGMDTAAKTGTTQDNHDKWLCGFTPYYTAATWYGYDTPTTIPNGSRTNANTIWKNVMTEIHKKLKKATFEKPNDIISVGVCKDSGLRATEICKKDQRGDRVYTEYFVKGTAPSKSCTCHVETEVCKVSNKVANEFCVEKENKVFITKEGKINEKAGDAEYVLSLKEDGTYEVCDVCKADDVLPILTLNGSSTINMKINETYVELGATATDNTDGDISAKIITTGTVNTKVAGTYTMTYTVSDTAGNVATVTRTVKVENVTEPNPSVSPTPSISITPTATPTTQAPTEPSAPTNTIQ